MDIGAKKAPVVGDLVPGSSKDGGLKWRLRFCTYHECSRKLGTAVAYIHIDRSVIVVLTIPSLQLQIVGFHDAIAYDSNI